MGKTASLILKISGILFLIPAVIFLMLGLWGLISGDDGFTDAAPWWVFFFMIAAVLGVTGSVFVVLGRFISKNIKERIDQT